MKKSLTPMLATANIYKIKLFYYATQNGREPVKEFIKNLPFETRYEVLTLLRRIENGEVLTMPHARSLSSIVHDLYA